ncbi:hypothetical protein MJO29_014463 [Puccinia striiformis f. sp. tritici]|nr:hypothetical protein MJO29_014463 [Puccinia striiformis f. sp. tritici]
MQCPSGLADNLSSRKTNSVNLASVKQTQAPSGSTRPTIDLLKSILRRSKALLFLVFVVIFFFLALSLSNIPIGSGFHDVWQKSSIIGKSGLQKVEDQELPEFCYDPYRLPGNVERSELPEGPISTVTWIANNPSAKARVGRPSGIDGQAPFIVPTISAQLLDNPDAPELQFLKNRTVIFVGDSLDRNEVYHLAQETFGPEYHKFLMPEDTPEIDSPSHQSHRIGLGVHPKLGLTVANWFLMSVDIDSPMTSFFHAGEDPPQLFEGRFEKFYEPLITKTTLLKSPPDMVVFNSGLWDLVYLSNLKDYEIDQNRTQGIMTTLQVTGKDLLTPTEIERHSTRFKKFINKLIFHTFNHTSSTPSKTRFVYRTMPDSSLTLAKKNSMSRKRVRQIDKLNLQIILEFNHLQSSASASTDGSKVLIDIIDWKWISSQLLDELIDLVHFGRGATQWLYGDMVLYHLRRHIINQELSTLKNIKINARLRKSLADSLVWKDCRRFIDVLDTANLTGHFALKQSRNLFNH